MSRVLVIGDLHAPAIKDGYLEHCKKVKKKYKCDTVVMIGDLRDMNTVSFYKSHPEDMSVYGEIEDANQQIRQWEKAFPNASVCIGNHDARVARLASDAGIPACYIKGYAEAFLSPDGWQWAKSFEIDGVYYTHQSGGGQNPAFALAKMRLQPCVLGHLHTLACINSTIGASGELLWGMQVGSGVDQTHKVLQWSADHVRRAILSCGVVVDGRPHLEYMS